MDISNTRQNIEGTDASPPPPPPWPSSHPDALSLYGIAHRHCRERLLVEPLQWTNCQLELLRISFSEPIPASSTSLLDHYSQSIGMPYMTSYPEKFQMLCSRESYFQKLLNRGECPFATSWNGLDIYLDCFPAHSTPSDPIYPRLPGPGWNYGPATGAYIDRGRIELLRQSSIHFHNCSSSNLPVQALLRHKWKSVNPTNPLKDPYIAALLIAIAQVWREDLREKKPEDLATMTVYPSQVLISSESTECVYLYKMDIPSSLLDMFDYPAVAPPPSPPFSIQIFTIPLEPISTFRDRIFELMIPITLDDHNRNKRKRL